MQSIKTQGNFLAYGPDGERRAAFALESDRRLFEAVPAVLAALQLVKEDIEGFLSGDWDGSEDGWKCTLSGIETAIRQTTRQNTRA